MKKEKLLGGISGVRRWWARASSRPPRITPIMIYRNGFVRIDQSLQIWPFSEGISLLPKALSTRKRGDTHSSFFFWNYGNEATIKQKTQQLGYCKDHKNKLCFVCNSETNGHGKQSSSLMGCVSHTRHWRQVENLPHPQPLLPVMSPRKQQPVPVVKSSRSWERSGELTERKTPFFCTCVVFFSTINVLQNNSGWVFLFSRTTSGSQCEELH